MSESSNSSDRPLSGDSEASQASKRPPVDEVDFLDMLIFLAKYKKVIIGLPLAVALISAGYTLTLPDVYTANTKILSPQQRDTASSAVLGQLGGLANLVGGAAGLRGSNDLYIGILRSRAIADRLIQRFNLIGLWAIDVKHPSDAYQRLAGITDITTAKEGYISVSVDDRDPKFAADLANAYVDELIKYTNVVALTDASRRRLFLEQKFAEAKDNLVKAEVAAQQALEQGGLVNVDNQGRVVLETTARLRAQMSAKEVEIGAMRTYASENNPDLRRAKTELEAMKLELSKMEGTGGGREKRKVSAGKGVDNLYLMRDLKYSETLYETLAKQYEMAKIDESKDPSMIQVLDKATEPDRKSKPNRRKFVMLAYLGALIASVLWGIAAEFMAKYQRDPARSPRLKALKSQIMSR